MLHIDHSNHRLSSTLFKLMNVRFPYTLYYQKRRAIQLKIAHTGVLLFDCRLGKRSVVAHNGQHNTGQTTAKSWKLVCCGGNYANLV
jgi:hypothetical protein